MLAQTVELGREKGTVQILELYKPSSLAFDHVGDTFSSVGPVSVRESYSFPVYGRCSFCSTFKFFPCVLALWCCHPRGVRLYSRGSRQRVCTTLPEKHRMFLALSSLSKNISIFGD